MKITKMLEEVQMTSNIVNGIKTVPSLFDDFCNCLAIELKPIINKAFFVMVKTY